MTTEEDIRKIFENLTLDSTFQTEQIIYDEKQFGNIMVILKSKSEVDIRFIKDRGSFWCEIGQNGEWFFSEDVFEVIGIEGIIEEKDFISMAISIFELIKANKEMIFLAFDASNRQQTYEKIKAFAKKRVLGIN